MDAKELISKLGLTNKSKDDKFEIMYANSRLNFGDIDSELMNRTPDDNDRPELERYFNSLYINEEGLTDPVIFYGYVANKKNNRKNSKNVVMLNIVNEFGEIMAAHVWTKNKYIHDCIGEVIRFEGRIYKYQYKDKYGIAVLSDTIEIIESRACGILNSHWNKMRIPSNNLKVSELINEFIKSDDFEKVYLLTQSERILDRISELMFGISGMIYPMVLNMYLMRDDTSDNKLIVYNIKHLVILTTIIIDYIITLQPTNYKELLYVLSYVIFNYMGMNVDNPDDKNSKKYLKQTLNDLKINYNHAEYHIENIIKSIGGNTSNIRNFIPEFAKSNPETLPQKAREQFAIRILSVLIPKNKQKYYLSNNNILPLIEHE